MGRSRMRRFRDTGKASPLTRRLAALGVDLFHRER